MFFFQWKQQTGIQDLKLGYEMDGIRKVLCVMTLLAYNLIVCYVLSHQEGDLTFCDEVLNEQLRVWLNDSAKTKKRNNNNKFICSLLLARFRYIRRVCGFYFSKEDLNLWKEILAMRWYGIKNHGNHKICGHNFIICAFGRFYGLTG